MKKILIVSLFMNIMNALLLTVNHITLDWIAFQIAITFTLILSLVYIIVRSDKK